MGEEARFKIGDAVQFVSGSPRLTVISTRIGDDGMVHTTCTWPRDGKLDEAEFPEPCLCEYESN